MLKKAGVVLSCTVLGALVAVAPSAKATEIIKYTGNPIIVYLNPHITRSVTFPHYISKIVTGIDTSKLSVERSNKTLFIKPLAKNVQGDFYVTETDGTIIHLILKTTKKRDEQDIRIILPLENAKKEIKEYQNETPIAFLKRIIKGDLENVDVEKAEGNVNLSLSKGLLLQITKVYEDPLYKAYFGYVYNESDRVVRIPVEDIFYKGLIGISPAKLYLKPHSRTNIYFVTYK